MHENEEKLDEVEILDGVVEDAEDAEIEEKDEYAELLDKYQRSLAEFDNFRKRTLREKSAAYDSGLIGAVEKLLPVIDNFNRALASPTNAEDSFYQGISMIAKQLDNYLAELGVEIIDTQTTEFDPNLHFAVAHVEDESLGNNEIVEELQKGYVYKGKTIRPSMVKVAN
ncbi:MAG: nucleotide exchange factor GrpE [Turicibacter sp.]|nr:nucleotide exchange factor GrpE [Turicibacter sp.]